MPVVGASFLSAGLPREDAVVAAVLRASVSRLRSVSRIQRGGTRVSSSLQTIVARHPTCSFGSHRVESRRPSPERHSFHMKSAVRQVKASHGNESPTLLGPVKPKHHRLCWRAVLRTGAFLKPAAFEPAAARLHVLQQVWGSETAD